MNLKRNTETLAKRNTATASTSAHDLENSSRVLTQEELLRWWPFTRLDPKRFPKAKKAETHEQYEDALF